MAALPTGSTVGPATWTPAHEVERRLRAEILDVERGALPVGADYDHGLHVCPSCRGPFVVPGQKFEAVGSGLCRLELECVDCGWHETGVYTDPELEALDRELDRGYADLLWALEIVWIGNEEEAIARFSTALAFGALLPEDF